MIVRSCILFCLLYSQSLSYREDFGLVCLSVTMCGKEYSEQVEKRWWRLVERISMLWIFVFDRTVLDNRIHFQFKTKRIFGLKNLGTDGVAETSLSLALHVHCVAKGLKYSGLSLLNFTEVNSVQRHLFCRYCSVTLPIASNKKITFSDSLSSQGCAVYRQISWRLFVAVIARDAVQWQVNIMLTVTWRCSRKWQCSGRWTLC